MVEKGNSYFLIVSPFLRMIQSITGDRSHADSALQLTPGTAELLPSARLTTFHPAHKCPEWRWREGTVLLLDWPLQEVGKKSGEGEGRKSQMRRQG